MIEPLVSICCITYNHEPFIANAIEGFLMQKTDYPYVIIIGEDCSTDKTRDIIERYADQNPELIKVITSDRNVGAVANECRVLTEAKGTYIAFCEGDDYWNYPGKLQRQADFLDTNPDYSVCFHRCKHHNVETNEWKEDHCTMFFDDNAGNGIDINTEMFFKQWITQPLTMFYRKDAFNPEIIDKYKHYRDMHLIYHLLQNGKGYLFSFLGGVHIVHNASMINKMNFLDRSIQGVNIAKELYSAGKTALLKENYCNMMQWAIYEISKNSFNIFNKRNPKLLLLKYALLHLLHSYDLFRFLRNIKFLFSIII